MLGFVRWAFPLPKTMKPTFIYDDGGRAGAGYKGTAGDCVVRAIAIASELPYQTVYDMVKAQNELYAATRRTKEARSIRKKGTTPRDGAYKDAYRGVLERLGFVWTPTMKFGEGCSTHLKADELPAGRIICNVSRHLVAVIDGVIHDTHDCSRAGTRCVYGYYKKEAN